MMRRKRLSVASHAAAAHRMAIAPSRHRVTRRVRRRTPDCGDSMRLVVARHRRSAGGRPMAFTVNVSWRPSHRHAAGADSYRSRCSVTSGLKGSNDSCIVHAMARSRMMRKYGSLNVK